MSRVTHPKAWILVGLLVAAAAIAALSLVYGASRGGEFEGADGQAEGTITEVAPDYEPWFESVLPELPGEVESGVFALQAGIGGGVVGYGLGVLRTRSRQRQAAARPRAGSVSAGGAGSAGGADR